jgi:hypothetical protein
MAADAGSRPVAEFLASLDDENPDAKLQAAEIYPANRALLGLDCESKQAGAVSLWAQLPDQYRERGACRYRGHPSQNV